MPDWAKVARYEQQLGAAFQALSRARFLAEDLGYESTVDDIVQIQCEIRRVLKARGRTPRPMKEQLSL